jgi:hypothetical protein
MKRIFMLAAFGNSEPTPPGYAASGEYDVAVVYNDGGDYSLDSGNPVEPLGCQGHRPGEMYIRLRNVDLDSSDTVAEARLWVRQPDAAEEGWYSDTADITNRCLLGSVGDWPALPAEYAAQPRTTAYANFSLGDHNASPISRPHWYSFPIAANAINEALSSEDWVKGGSLVVVLQPSDAGNDYYSYIITAADSRGISVAPHLELMLE